MKLNTLALPHLEKVKGTIVNVSSVDAHNPVSFKISRNGTCD